MWLQQQWAALTPNTCVNSFLPIDGSRCVFTRYFGSAAKFISIEHSIFMTSFVHGREPAKMISFVQGVSYSFPTKTKYRRAWTTETWWLDSKFCAAQNNIAILNRKPCKMYENICFLKKKGGSNAESQTTDKQYYQNTIKYLKICSIDLPNRPKYLWYLKKSSHWVSVVRVEEDFLFSPTRLRY